MARITPKLSEKVYPGCGYRIFDQSTAPATPFLNQSKENSKNSILNLIPEILITIKNSDENEHNQFSPNFILPTKFDAKTMTKYDFFKTESLSDAVSMLGYNKCKVLDMITQNSNSLLHNISFEKDYHCILIKVTTELLKWSLDKTQCGNIQNTISPNFSRNHGDCFITELNFGRESQFLMSLPKSDLSHLEIDQNNIENLIKSVFLSQNENGQESSTESVTDLKNYLNTKKIHISPLMVNKQSEKRDWNFKLLLDYIQTHRQRARLYPTIIDAKVEFYPPKIYPMSSPSASSPQKIYQTLTSDFVPNCVDLFQSLQFLQQSRQLHISNTLHPSPAEETNQSLIKAVNEHLSSAKKYFIQLKKYSSTSIRPPPFIPPAAEVMNSLIAPKQTQKTNHSQTKGPIKNITRAEPIKPSFNTFNSSATISFKDDKLRSSVMKNEEKIEVISYESLVELCSKLSKISADLQNKLRISELPVYYMKLDGDGNEIDLLEYDRKIKKIGPGELLHRVPASFDEWIDSLKLFLKEHSSTPHRKLPKHVDIYQLKEKPYQTAPMPSAVVMTQNLTSIGARSASLFPDGKRFFFHPITHAKLEDYKGLYDSQILTDEEKYGRLAEMFKRREEVIEEEKRLNNEIQAEMFGLPGESMFWPSLLSQHPELKEETVGEIDFIAQKCQDREITPHVEKILTLLKEIRNDDRATKMNQENTDLIKWVQSFQDESARRAGKKLELSLRGYSNDTAEEPEFSLLKSLQLQPAAEED